MVKRYKKKGSGVLKRCPKTHKHWIFPRTGMYAKNILHPVSMKHRIPESQFRHDMKTGKYQKWLKKNRLRMTDASHDKYLRKLKKK